MSKELIEAIYQILAERQAAVLKNVLVIVFGCNHNEDQIMHLLKNQREDCHFTILFSAKRCFVSETSSWEQIGEKEDAFQLLQAGRLKEFDTVLVPFMTRNSLAKTVYGIADSGELTVLQHAFLMGKEVIISNHGFRLDTDHAVYNGLDKNPFIFQQVQEHEELLKKMGAKVGDLQTFKGLLEASIGKATKVVTWEKSQGDKRIITQQDLKKNPDMTIPEGAILTDLAKEQIKKNKA